MDEIKREKTDVRSYRVELLDGTRAVLDTTKDICIYETKPDEKKWIGIDLYLHITRRSRKKIFYLRMWDLFPKPINRIQPIRLKDVARFLYERFHPDPR